MSQNGPNKSEVGLRKDHRHFRSRLHTIVLKHVWDQLFTVKTIWNIGETGDINPIQNGNPICNQIFSIKFYRLG